MSALKYLNENFPINTLQGQEEIYKSKLAKNGRFTINEAEYAVT